MNRGKIYPYAFRFSLIVINRNKPQFCTMAIKSTDPEFNFNNELSGKIALVTGGTKGAGKAIAERLLQAGAMVIITARNQPANANEKLHFIPADLSTPAGTQKVVIEVLEKYGRLDILV